MFHLFIILFCSFILFLDVFSLRFNTLEEKLTTTSLEKLNELTLNIFNINSEEDVLKIIH